jgi:hypothetical protein
MFEWPIEDIVPAHPDLYVEHCAVMAVALMSRYSASPCEFFVECEGFSPPALEGETSCVLRVVWQEQTALTAAGVWLSEPPHRRGGLCRRTVARKGSGANSIASSSTTASENCISRESCTTRFGGPFSRER